jgi:5-formyltetrahydrofolate cyclo-ligase
MEVRPYDGEDMMRKGRLGVPEPQTPTYKGHIDLMLVPGVVFDHHCNRIGRGGGYYDKFLAKYPHVKKVGVCYAFQLKKHEIPHLWRDRKVDRVVTPQQTIG